VRHCLVVAHQTLDSPRLADAILEEASKGPCTFHLLVPVFHHGDGLTWTDAEVRSVAQDHLDAALLRFRADGFAVDGEVAGPSPVDAVGDVLIRDGAHAYDQVIVSTLPHVISRWLKIDVPTRIEQNTGLPVRHVEAPAKAPH
jgi:hypothetical protein